MPHSGTTKANEAMDRLLDQLQHFPLEHSAAAYSSPILGLRRRWRGFKTAERFIHCRQSGRHTMDLTKHAENPAPELNTYRG